MDFLVTNLELMEVEVGPEQEYSSLRAIQAGRKDWWVGGSDLQAEGDWRWSSSQEEVGDFVWYSRQPNGGSDQNCMDLYPAAGYLAVDYYCDSMYHTICQIKMWLIDHH